MDVQKNNKSCRYEKAMSERTAKKRQFEFTVGRIVVVLNQILSLKFPEFI